MKILAQTLSSMEVAEMIEKEHHKLLRDIRTYTEQLNESKIGLVDFFTESIYKDSKGEERPCYQVTKKGCEFIAHKLTGVKGTAFTAKYINRFHDMEVQIKSVPEVGRRKITFLQEIKAAEHVTKGMNQQQRIEIYKSIYKRHGLKLNIEAGQFLEDRRGSYCETYRRESINAIGKIRNEIRLQQIFTISKKMLESDINKNGGI